MSVEIELCDERVKVVLRQYADVMGIAATRAVLDPSIEVSWCMAASESELDLSAVSPDVRAQIEAALRSAEITAQSAQKATRLTVAGAIAAALITGLATYFVTTTSTSRVNLSASSSGGSLSFSLTSPADGSTIGQVVNVGGQVSGLSTGEFIWTFNEPLASGNNTYFPNTGPCAVTSDMWTCDGVDIGGPATSKYPRNGLGSYRIWAVVVSARDAFDIVNHIRCFPSGKPSVAGIEISAACPDSYSSLPGSDIYPPQEAAVNRTH
jgi:hypothetical protein